MLVTENKEVQMDHLLNEMAKSLQLDETRYNRMITSYEAIKKWIESDELFFKPYKYEVYPHGSVRVFTTVKPIGKLEFDLDIVIHFNDSYIPHSPLKIYTELIRRLNENETYKKMLEKKNRVIRLNYSGDFHMDIMPGIQSSAFNVNKIKIPDIDLGMWVFSNPRGFAEWFMFKANLVQESLLERSLKSEKIQTDNFNNKKPLQRAVQLIKRYRDIYFENDNKYQPRSIILTTIAGQMYNGEDSIYETIENIINRIKSSFQKEFRIKIYNPVDNDEDFTDKWDSEPEYYEAFKEFINHLAKEWQKLKMENGVLEESFILKRLFGNDLVNQVQIKESETISLLRENKELNIARNSGILTNVLSNKNEPIVKNTFYCG